MPETERANAAETVSDEDLVRRAVAGRGEAFAELYVRFHTGAARLALAMTGDRAAAEDLTQEIFMRVFERLGQFEGRSRFSTWFHRIAVNQCLRYRATRRHDRSLSAADEAESAAPGETSERRYLRDEIGEHVRRALLGLPPKYRIIVVLKDVEGLSYAEIADRIGCSEGTVASRLSRARRHLARRLAHLKGAV